MVVKTRGIAAAPYFGTQHRVLSGFLHRIGAGGDMHNRDASLQEFGPIAPMMHSPRESPAPSTQQKIAPPAQTRPDWPAGTHPDPGEHWKSGAGQGSPPTLPDWTQQY